MKIAITVLSVDAAYLRKFISVVERRQHDCYLISVPVEFTAFVFEFGISGTFVSVTDVGHRDVRLSECSLIDHRYDGDAQRFAESERTEETEKGRDIEDESTERNVETTSWLFLRCS